VYLNPKLLNIQSANHLSETAETPATADTWTPSLVGRHINYSIPYNRGIFSVTYDLRCLAEVLPISVASPDASVLSWRQKRGEIPMFVQTIDNFDPGRKVARRPCLPSLFIALALAFAFAIHPSEAQAQIVGDIDA
jgi:hypothetical protein